ncbi:hypothetical protein KR018_009114, partial [Drosophila ironensis]
KTQPQNPKNNAEEMESVPAGITKSILSQDIATDKPDETVEYDYMKYPNQKKNKLQKKIKPQKNVTFKMMVELVTYTDNWKMKMIECKLRTEEEQV